MSGQVDIDPGAWCEIGRVLPRFRDWQSAPHGLAKPLDSRTLAHLLDALAKRYDADAREARQSAAACRTYARELRSGTA